MKAKLLALLQIAPREARIVFLCFCFAFCVGIAHNIALTVPLALFLGKYNGAMLSYLYIASGLLTFCAGSGFFYLQRRVSIFHVLSIPLAALGAIYFLFWLALLFFQPAWIFMALQLWSLSFVTLLITLTGVMFNQVFTLQQGKRLFGFVAAATALGGMTLGFTLDFLVYAIGPVHVVLLASIALFAAFRLQYAIRKQATNRFAAKPIQGGEFANKHYVLTGFFFNATIVFIYFCFDLIFNITVQNTLHDELKMAGFYGALYGVCNMCMLLSGFFFSSFVFTRLGLIFALVLMPMGIACLMTGALICNLFQAGFAMFVIFIIIAIFEEVINESINNEAIFLLFQPLRPAQRAWAQLKSEIAVAPLATMTIGIILTSVQHFGRISIQGVGWLIVGICIFSSSLALFVIRRGYVQLLTQALGKKEITRPSFTKLDKEGLAQLDKYLRSQWPEEVIYVLRTLEEVDREKWEKELLASLGSPILAVREYALQRVEKVKLQSAEPLVRQICLNETGSILRFAYPAMAALGHLDLARKGLEKSEDIVVATMSALCKYSASERNLVKEKAFSSLKTDRLFAAEVFQEVNFAGEADVLLALMHDASFEVRAAACKAAGKTRDVRLIRPLIENLPRIKECAPSLHSLSALLFPVLQESFDTFSLDVQREIIKLLGGIAKKESTLFLHEKLSTQKKALLPDITEALSRSGFKAKTAADQELIDKLLSDEDRQLRKLKKWARNLSSLKESAIYSFLSHEIELSQRRALSLLSLLYDSASIAKVTGGLFLGDPDVTSNALELLLNIMHQRYASKLFGSLSYRPEEEDPAHPERVPATLVAILTSSSFTIPTLPVAAMYAIGDLGLQELSDFLRKYAPQEIPFMEETHAWVLDKLKIALK